MANRFFPNYNTYKITSKFGKRTINGKTSQHNGIDLVARADNGGSRTDYITAHTAGVVDGVGYDKSCGNWVRIKVANKVFMHYYHLKNKSTLKKGAKVKQGEVIGYMGSTGNSTGAHLHFGIKDSGKWVNPEPYLDKDYIEVKPATTTTFAIGEKVKLKANATYYNGKKIPNWVKKSTLYVREIKGNRVVISILKIGAVTGAVDIKYLTK